ncbi:MAG: hypothetical protein Q9182_003806 [Xanthomendoza sp. 2 TL-2023]
MGRNAPIRGIENTTGPTFATAPEKGQIQSRDIVKDMLRAVQEQSIAAIELEQTVPSSTGKEQQRLGIFENGSDEAHTEGAFDAYALTALCTLNDDSIQVELRFDDHNLDSMKAQGILDQFTHILQQTCQNPEQRYEEIATPSPGSLQRLCEWNGTAPAKVDACIHNLIKKHFGSQASSQAVARWDGDFSYQELDELSSKLATHFVGPGVRPEQFVPLCFEKSKWVIIGIIGVLRAGAAFVLINPEQPMRRLKYIVDQTGSSLILASKAQSTLASELLKSDVVISGSDCQWKKNSELHGTFGKTDNAASAVFTSGTTGIPKGVVIEHGSYCTAATVLRKALYISDQTRPFQFASFSLDVSISDILTTLIAGGCTCIPSEQDKLNNMTQAINDMDVNRAHLTPSVIRLLSPKIIPKVNRVVLSGETMSAEDLSQWVNQVHLINANGPAQCSVYCTVQSNLTIHSNADILALLSVASAGLSTLKTATNCSQ